MLFACLQSGSESITCSILGWADICFHPASILNPAAELSRPKRASTGVQLGQTTIRAIEATLIPHPIFAATSRASPASRSA